MAMRLETMIVAVLTVVAAVCGLWTGQHLEALDYPSDTDPFDTEIVWGIEQDYH